MTISTYQCAATLNSDLHIEFNEIQLENTDNQKLVGVVINKHLYSLKAKVWLSTDVSYWRTHLLNNPYNKVFIIIIIIINIINYYYYYTIVYIYKCYINKVFIIIIITKKSGITQN